MNKSINEQGDFLNEAQLALNDLGDGIVAEKYLSKHLNNPSNCSIAYINIKSKENKEFCIELTRNGYRVIGKHFDVKNEPSINYYESLQALLTNESKSYVDSFAQSLQEKLLAAQNKLRENQENDDDEDENIL